jgi:multidrug efflux pump
VFIPLLFMEGVVGRLFREFAETLTAAVLVSMVISLTLTPMMCALVLRDPKQDRPGLAARWTGRAFDKMRDGYGRALAFTMRHQLATLLVAGASVVLTGWLYVVMPKGFLPQQDTGLILITTEAPQDVSFARLAEMQQALAEVVRADPAVASVASVAGSGTLNPAPNTGRVTAVLRRAPSAMPMPSPSSSG